MTNKVYFVAGQPDDWAVICESLADAQNELFLRGCEDEFVYVADAMEVDVDSLAASVSLSIKWHNKSTYLTGLFIHVAIINRVQGNRNLPSLNSGVL